MANVLLVEDDEGVRAALDLALSGLGHDVTGVSNGASALTRLACDDHRVDCVVLDVMMPGLDGLEVCRRIRRDSRLPVIMLTARSEPIDVVAGLECGADDYVAKPAEPRVLDARIKALLRRASWPIGPAGSATRLIVTDRGAVFTLVVPKGEPALG